MDLNKVIAGLTNSGLAGGLAGGMAAGALTSALMGKKGGKLAKTALKVGGLAAAGGLALKAYQTYRERQTTKEQTEAKSSVHGQTEQPWHALSESAFAVDDTDAAEGSTGLLLVRAMIAAANADGHIDAVEKGQIFEKVEKLGLSGAEKGLLFDELSHPASMEELLSGVNDRETALELYAASLLAVDETQPESQRYLQILAERLALPVGLVDVMHMQVDTRADAA